MRSPRASLKAAVAHAVSRSPSTASAGRPSAAKVIGFPYDVASTWMPPRWIATVCTSEPASGNRGRRLSVRFSASWVSSTRSVCPRVWRSDPHRSPRFRLPSVTTNEAPRSSSAATSSGSRLAL